MELDLILFPLGHQTENQKMSFEQKKEERKKKKRKES
jgi:hypothetical protein